MMAFTNTSTHNTAHHLHNPTPRLIQITPSQSHRQRLSVHASSSSSSTTPAASTSDNGNQQQQQYHSNTTNKNTDQFFKPGYEGQSRQQLFSNISPVYDELNDTLSLGLHRVWKRMTANMSGARPGNTVLDVCCGSGDIAFRLASIVGPRGRVVGLDFSGAMLDDAAARQAAANTSSPLPSVPMEWVQGDAMDLPFADASFDAVTMGYGLRNVADRPRALKELERVLKPGSKVAILDFNNSEDALVDGVQEFMLENVVVPAARSKGVEAEYQYLRPSIKNFPTGKQLEQLALEAGFSTAKHYEIGFGLMGVLLATKKNW